MGFDSGGAAVSRSTAPRMSAIGWLLGALLLAAVGFGIYLWGKPTSAPHTTSAPPIAPSSHQPSSATRREPMPVGNIPGWREVFSDNFNGHSLSLSKWRVYWGSAGGHGFLGYFAPTHVSVRNGMLVISAYRDPAYGEQWVTGGINSDQSFAQTYGKYLVRFRFAPGTGIGHALLLTPANGTWPPEIDFSEDNGTTRSWTMTTLHFPPDDTMISRLLTVNLTQWHTLGIEWMPGLLRYTVDGRVWSTVRSAGVPSIPMSLAIQTEVWPCTGSWGTCPNAGTPRVVNLDVDWVVAYAPTGLK
jgi:beta-glucanase (GH16 family)